MAGTIYTELAAQAALAEYEQVVAAHRRARAAQRSHEPEQHPAGTRRPWPPVLTALIHWPRRPVWPAPSHHTPA